MSEVPLFRRLPLLRRKIRPKFRPLPPVYKQGGERKKEERTKEEDMKDPEVGKVERLVWWLGAQAFGRLAGRLDRGVTMAEAVELWCLHRLWGYHRRPRQAYEREVLKDSPLVWWRGHGHHVHISSAWPEVARFRPPAEDR